MSQPAEGVVKFNLRFTSEAPLPASAVRELEAWRTLMRRLELVGQDPGRYEGFGFGNLSRRLEPWDAPAEKRRFLITGTQTGGLLQLGPQGYAVVTCCRPEENEVVAEGPVRPSAESLTHGSLYGADTSIRWVFHAHSPELWSRAESLGLPVTPEDIPYGTPELARAVRQMMEAPAVRREGILAVGGHEDGIFSFGSTAEEAGKALIGALARALSLEIQ